MNGMRSRELADRLRRLLVVDGADHHALAASACSAIASSDGISSRQGSHQVAQKLSTTTLPACASRLPGLAIEVDDVELGHGPCRGPGLDDVCGRERAARQAKRSAGARRRRRARDGGSSRPGERSAGASLHSGRSRDKVSGRAADAPLNRPKGHPMTDSDRRASSRAPSPTPGRTRRAPPLLATQAEHRAEVLLRPLGSRLFEAITELPEYYPTRTEAAIFAARGAEMRAAFGTGMILVDLGAGNCAKAMRLFPVLEPQALHRRRHLGRVPARGAAPGAARASAARRGRASARTSQPARPARRAARAAARRSSSIPARASATSPATRPTPSCAGSVRSAPAAAAF